MLVINPKSFLDANTLKLRTIPCKYSQTCFYNDFIAANPINRNSLITE